MRKGFPGSQDRTGVHSAGTERGPAILRAHEKVGLWKDNLLRARLEVLKPLSMLFQISGAEKIYLKGYEKSLFKRENLTSGIRTEVGLEIKCP